MNSPAEDPYFSLLESRVDDLIRTASEARAKGMDVSREVETKKANTLSDRIVALFGHPELGERISYWLSEGVAKRELAFTMADEIMSEAIKLDLGPAKRAELAVRVGLAIMTGATVSAPIEGLNKVSIRRNPEDGSNYLSIYFNSPIRTAGGTDGALCVVLADYIRQNMGLAPYKPGEREIGRYVEEVSLYKRTRHLQYNSKPEEVEFVARHLPIEITGPPTEKVEVAAYRNLRTVETNRLRGGAVLALNDCVLQKAPKMLKEIGQLREGGLDIRGWEWAREFETKPKEEERGGSCPYIKPSYKYMRESVVGRPIFSYPCRSGGFRLRYGHSRNTGLASIGLHPATMIALDEFIAVGSQVRIEKPGKSSVITPVDSIEGPIVRLKGGEVTRLEDEDRARELADQIDQILFLGDVLIGFGEFLQNNHPLLPSSWVEEWWLALAEGAARERGLQIPSGLLGDRAGKSPSVDDAVRLSLLLDIPLHPRWTYFWHDIGLEDFSYLLQALSAAEVRDGDISAEKEDRLKEVLEVLGVPHRIDGQQILIEGDDAKALLVSLGGLERAVKEDEYAEWDVMKALNDLSPVVIMPKAPTYIGMRLGRPEKAKPRQMRPPINLLFAIGSLRGRSRFVLEAYKRGSVTVEIALRKCPDCGETTVGFRCRQCGARTGQLYFCPRCGNEIKEGGKCPVHNLGPVPYKQTTVDIRSLIDAAVSSLGEEDGSVLQKVRAPIGLVSGGKHPEPVEKGLLRAKHDLFVFKDGTCRFDCTNAVLTHFTPEEAGVSVEKLRELGYEEDARGNRLERKDQLLELKISDMIIPRDGARYLLRVARFLDEELERFYGLPSHYGVRDVGDLIGRIIFTISPHTFVANTARIVGFTDASVVFAHPFLHAAKRRDADGDEDSLILGLDLLLNFSRYYLPATPGGREDAPLLLITDMDLKYIGEEIYDIEVVPSYPLEFYGATLEYKNPLELGGLIQTVATSYSEGQEHPSIPFTHATSKIDRGPLVTLYRRLNTMAGKLERHISLEAKIRALDKEDSISRAISAHFLRDISGNLRKFSMQGFRCPKCNVRYRRPPLSGRCEKCGAKLVLTVYPKSTTKYMAPALETLNQHNIGGYVYQRLKLLEEESKAMFAPEKGEKKGELAAEFLTEAESPKKRGLVDFL